MTADGANDDPDGAPPAGAPGRTVSLGGGVVVPYPEPSNATASKIGRANRRRDTKPEIRIRSNLHGRGLRYRKDLLLRSGDVRVRPDVVFTRRRIAVFVDGCFWHGCPDHQHTPKRNREYWAPKLRANVDRDRRVDAALAADGWTVIRIWEHEDPDHASERVEVTVRERAERTAEL